MTIEQRLSSFERSNSRLRLACAAMTLAIVAVFVVGAEKDAAAVQDVVRAKKIEVIGGDGKPAIALHGLGQDGSEIELFGPRNKRLVQIIAEDAGAGFHAWSPHGQQYRAGLDAMESASGLGLYQLTDDGKGQMVSDKDEVGVTVLRNNTGTHATFQQCWNDPTIQVLDNNSHVVWAAPSR